jgi:hypothetical protein
LRRATNPIQVQASDDSHTPRTRTAVVASRTTAVPAAAPTTQPRPTATNAITIATCHTAIRGAETARP